MSCNDECGYWLPRQVANYKENIFYDDDARHSKIYSKSCQTICQTPWDGNGGGCDKHRKFLGQCQGLILSPETYYPYELCQNQATLRINIGNDRNGMGIINITERLRCLVFCQECYQKYYETKFNYYDYYDYYDYTYNQNQSRDYATVAGSVNSRSEATTGAQSVNSMSEVNTVDTSDVRTLSISVKDSKLIAFSVESVIDKIYCKILDTKDKFNPKAKRFEKNSYPNVSIMVKESCCQENIIEPEFAYLDRDANNLFFVYRKKVNDRLIKNNSKIKYCHYRLNYGNNEVVNDCFCHKKMCNYYYLEGFESCPEHLAKSDINGYVNQCLFRVINLPNEILYMIACYCVIWDDTIGQKHTPECINLKRFPRVKIYAVNYNILRIISGQGGLSFSC